jgi:hypothetical protein
MGKLYLPIRLRKYSTDIDKIWYCESTLNFPGKFSFSLYQSIVSPSFHEAKIGIYQFPHTRLIV